MIKGSIHQDDVTLLNTHVPNNRGSKHMKWRQLEDEAEIDKPTITLELQLFLQWPAKQGDKASASITCQPDLTITEYLMQMINLVFKMECRLYRISCPKATWHTLFWTAQTFTKTDHILIYKTSKKSNKIIQSMFSIYNKIKPRNQLQKEMGKNHQIIGN